MFNDPLSGNEALGDAQAFDLLSELERNTPEEVRRRRTHFRLQIKVKVTLLPGNASERLDFCVQGVSGDISEGGCRALFSLPARVGDVYRLEFDADLQLPVTYARCVRCLLLRDDAFEAGFAFFAPISLPEVLPEHIEGSLTACEAQ